MSNCRVKTSYLGEFATNWRYLTAASIGIASGYGINNYLNNVFIPPLMQEFGWESSKIALLGLAALVSVMCQPIAGRITDKLGVRMVALFGICCGTAIYIALSFMRGSFIEFFLLNVALISLVSATTATVVYSRLIAETYHQARGMALAIATCSPSIAGAIVVPIISEYIDEEGWRAGYLAVAVCTAIGGAIAILLITPKSNVGRGLGFSHVHKPAPFKEIARNPAFKLIVIGTILCSLTIVMQTTQLKVILLDTGITSSQASMIISIYALGVITGRLLCGAALDRFPTHIVAAISLGLPCIGLVILSLGMPSLVILAIGVLFLGFSLGAEGDVAGFLVMTFFKVEVYSTVVGIIIGSIAFSSALGSVILSGTLRITGNFTIFLLFAAVSALFGSRLFWQLKDVRPAVPRPPEPGNESDSTMNQISNP